MTPTTLYIALLVVGVALTFLVGRLLVTAGEPFLQEVFRDRSVTRSVTRRCTAAWSKPPLRPLGGRTTEAT